MYEFRTGYFRLYMRNQKLEVASAVIIAKTEVRGFAPIEMLEFYNFGIMGSGLRLGEDIGMVGLEN